MQYMRHGKLALAVIAGALVLTACSDSTGIVAQLPTITDSYQVYALTGTPASSPSGINTYVRSAVRVDGNANFDVAFDLNPAGQVLIYPVQKVVNTIQGNRQVGMRKVAGPAASVTIAPTGTYLDSTVVAAPGDVIIVQALRNGTNDACAFDISPYIYTKLVIDSVSPPTRSIFVGATLDPNCGFRSFAEGLPTK